MYSVEKGTRKAKLVERRSANQVHKKKINTKIKPSKITGKNGNFHLFIHLKVAKNEFLKCKQVLHEIANQKRKTINQKDERRR